LEISVRYVQAARLQGDDAELITLEHADHFDLVDPGSKEFGSVMTAAAALVR
jgi:hypothetical protein